MNANIHSLIFEKKSFAVHLHDGGNYEVKKDLIKLI